MDATHNNDTTNGRVTTRQFYEALLAQNGAMAEMERRLVERMDKLAAAMSEVAALQVSVHDMDKRMTKAENDIETLRQSDKRYVALNTLLAAIIGAVSSLIGISK